MEEGAYGRHHHVWWNLVTLPTPEARGLKEIKSRRVRPFNDEEEVEDDEQDEQEPESSYLPRPCFRPVSFSLTFF
jgi:hypothetical protein